MMCNLGPSSHQFQDSTLNDISVAILVLLMINYEVAKSGLYWYDVHVSYMKIHQFVWLLVECRHVGIMIP